MLDFIKKDKYKEYVVCGGGVRSTLCVGVGQ